MDINKLTYELIKDLLPEDSIVEETYKGKKTDNGAPGTFKAKITKAYGGDVTIEKAKKFKERENATPLDKKQANWFINFHKKKVNEEDNFHQKALSQTEKQALQLTYKNWDIFGGKECNNGFCDIFAKNLSKYLPGSKIMSTEDPRSNTLGHVWVEYKGKYFDAETPNGVDSWKQLPWMERFYAKNNSYPSGIEYLNEVGEASASKYKWYVMDKEGYFVYIRFRTDSGTIYDVDLESLMYTPKDSTSGIKALNIEFTAGSTDVGGNYYSSSKVVMNKGEMYKVMATIVDIIRTYIKKSKAQAIMYSPVKKQGEEAGSQRDQLYRAFISKAAPGAKFEQKGDMVVAILPTAPVKESLDTRDTTLEEGKQVGPLYHYTSADGLEGILNSNRINASEENYMGNELYYVSFTRNKNFHNKGSKFGVNTDYRITLDGDKLSNKYRITPFAYKPGWNYEDNWEYDWLEDEPESVVRDFFNNTGDYDEQEERISFKSPEGGIDNIENYIIAIDKIETPQDVGENINEGLYTTDYTFEPPVQAQIQPYLQDLTKYMYNQGLNIDPAPELEFVEDSENAKDVLGKTAYYDPNNKVIVLYTADRHPKDILRSFAHEMIHHIQNLERRLTNINTTNVNEDEYLADIEREAYSNGNMIFRAWENDRRGNNSIRNMKGFTPGSYDMEPADNT